MGFSYLHPETDLLDENGRDKRGYKYRFSYFMGRRVNYSPSLCDSMKNGQMHPLEILIPNKCATARSLVGIYSTETICC